MLVPLLLLLLTALLPAQQVVDGVVAIVGDDVVLLSEINTLVAQYAFQNKVDISKNPQLYKQLSHQFLQNLIDQKLMLIKADEDTIKVDDEAVDQNVKQQLDYLVSQAGSQEKLEEYYGSPIFKIKKDLRKEIANQMRTSTLREKKFADVKVSRKEVENFFKTYQDSLPERKASVDISHILIQVAPSDSSITRGYEKALEIKKKLDEGEDFATLAKQYSDDTGSAANGGDLGFVERGSLVKEFEEAAFSLQPGQISDIVQTQFGFHIIQLLERQGEKIHVRHILIRVQPTEQDNQRAVAKLMDIRKKILDGDSTFEEMALRYSEDPNVQKDHGHLGEFETGGFQIKEFAEAIKGLKVGEISEPFKTEFGYHIVQLNKRTEARTYTLSRDWEQIEQWALQYKREHLYKEWLAQIREEIPVIIKMSI